MFEREAYICDTPTNRDPDSPNVIPTTQLELPPPDHFEVVRQLGAGGMATVYLARDRWHSRRPVALKVCNALQYNDRSRFQHDFGRERFALRTLRYARSAHLPRLYGSGSCGSNAYLTLGYVNGWTAADLIKERAPGGLPLQVAAEIAYQVCDALAWVHYFKLCHFDVKPANILISRQGCVVLSDFGLTRPEQEPRNGIAAGTPSFMSPEQARAQNCDHRTDIYSLGLVLFNLLTGFTPLEGVSALETMLMHANDDVPDVRQFVAGIPDELASIVVRATQRRPGRRYDDIEQMEHALATYASGSKVLAKFLAPGKRLAA